MTLTPIWWPFPWKREVINSSFILIRWLRLLGLATLFPTVSFPAGSLALLLLGCGLPVGLPSFSALQLLCNQVPVFHLLCVQTWSIFCLLDCLPSRLIYGVYFMREVVSFYSVCIFFSAYNVLHVCDISKGVYQIEIWIADVEKIEKYFLLLLWI